MKINLTTDYGLPTFRLATFPRILNDSHKLIDSQFIFIVRDLKIIHCSPHTVHNAEHIYVYVQIKFQYSRTKK